MQQCCSANAVNSDTCISVQPLSAFKWTSIPELLQTVLDPQKENLWVKLNKVYRPDAIPVVNSVSHWKKQSVHTF